MTLPLVPHSCRGDKAREGMRHLLFLTLATSEQIARQGQRHLGSGVQILPESRQCVCKCLKCAVWCACVSALLDLHCWQRLCKPCPPRHMRSFLRVSNMCTGPTCLYSTVNALSGYQCLRAIRTIWPLVTCLFRNLRTALFGYESLRAIRTELFGH